MKGYMCIVCSPFQCLAKVALSSLCHCRSPIGAVVPAVWTNEYMVWTLEVDHIKTGILDGFCVVLVLQISWLMIDCGVFIQQVPWRKSCMRNVLFFNGRVSIIRKKTRSRGCRFIPCILGHVQYRCLHSLT